MSSLPSFETKFIIPISLSISKGPFDQLNPHFIASSISLKFSVTAFFENYGTAFTILTNLFGEGEYNKHIPKFDGLLGAVLSLSFSLYAYVYILSRASFLYQSQNLIDLGRSLGFSKFKSLYSLILPALVAPAIG